jgi:hypothetical protein
MDGKAGQLEGIKIRLCGSYTKKVRDEGLNAAIS